jgi:hypothetical protein
MDHAAVVRIFQGFDDLLGHMDRLLRRHCSSGDAIRQRWSFDERKDQRARVFGVRDSVNVSDIGVIERRQNLGFPLDRAIRSGSRKNDAGRTFNATSRFSLVSRAR